MTVDFNAWAARGDAIRIFLVETYAVRLSDSTIVSLFFSNHPSYFDDCQFLPCLAGAPTLSRTANDITTPNHCPTWGELEFLISPEFKPDSERSVTWSELLTDDYNLIGQKLYIRLGGVGFAYTDFVKIFDGAIGGLGEWTDTSLKLTIYDKSHDLEAKLPDWGINSIFVPADSRGKTLPIQLGHCLNIKPVMINNADTFALSFFPPVMLPAHQYRWALAGHTVTSVEDIFDNGVSILSTMLFTQKDVSIPSKNANGAAVCYATGPYTGSEVERNWLIEIDSVAAGAYIGSATFRWSVDGGITWQASGLSTWNLIYTVASKIINNDLSSMSLSGTYTGQTKSAFLAVVTTEGGFGTAQFNFSKDGVTPGAPRPIVNAPISVGDGMFANFVDGGTTLGSPAKIPVNPSTPSPGDMSNSGPFTGIVTSLYGILITVGGSIGDATPPEFSWTDDNWVTSTTNVQILSTDPIALSNGVYVSFTHPGVPADDDYDVGDGWWFGAYPSFVVGSEWSWTTYEYPLFLDAGVNIQFVTTGYVDFSLGDQWTFRLISTIVADTLDDSSNITVNLFGMLSQVYGGYIDRISQFFHELPVRYKNWDPTTDFDNAALTVFYALFPFAVQYSSDEPSTILDIFDTLLTGIPGYYTTRLDGKLLLAPIQTPSGTPGAIFSEIEIMEPPTFKYDTDNLYYRVFLNYDHNPNINDKPGTTAGIYFSNWLKFEWRSLQASIPAILETYPWALDLGPLDTCIYSMEWSNWVAWMLLDIYGVRRQLVTIVTEIRPFAYDLGMVVELIWPAFGMETGKLFRLVGMDLDFSSNQSTLTLWR